MTSYLARSVTRSTVVVIVIVFARPPFLSTRTLAGGHEARDESTQERQSNYDADDNLHGLRVEGWIRVVILWQVVSLTPFVRVVIDPNAAVRAAREIRWTRPARDFLAAGTATPDN